MALSDKDLEILKQLEEQIHSDDPEFASTMAMREHRPQRRPFNVTNIVVGILVAAIGLGVLLTGVTIKQIWLGVLGFALIAAGGFWTTKRSPASANQPNAPAAKKTQQPSGNFMENLERRWDERNTH